MTVPAGYQATSIAAPGVASVAVNTSTKALLVDSKPGVTVLGMASCVPAATDKLITASPLSVVIPEGTLRMIVWASAAGVYLNYDAAATTDTLPVPTTPFPIDITAAGAAKLHALGDAAKKLNIVFQG